MKQHFHRQPLSTSRNMRETKHRRGRSAFKRACFRSQKASNMPHQSGRSGIPTTVALVNVHNHPLLLGPGRVYFFTIWLLPGRSRLRSPASRRPCANHVRGRSLGRVLPISLDLEFDRQVVMQSGARLTDITTEWENTPTCSKVGIGKNRGSSTACSLSLRTALDVLNLVIRADARIYCGPI